MADLIIPPHKIPLHKLEWLLAFLLAVAAVISVTKWNSPCCAIILMYFAVRILLYGLLTVGV
jgi:hypothetical protein